ncbi:MAG: proline iminopeptidase-family hydrolase [Acidimicrobiia bacterium]|nr:proline iminopeptidase-family hydrolase [Acidimicrobiia bacterium]
MQVRDGRVSVDGGQVWYRLVGLGDTPLVTLHGGPGWPSPSLTPLEALASERPVLFYDQLGCGRSDRPDDPALWSVERFVAELLAVVDHLGFTRFDLLGHSWGTMLATEFALAYPDRIRAMILASPALSAARWSADCERLIVAMGDEWERIYRDAEPSPDDAERLERAFMSRYFCRLDPRPQAMVEASEQFGAQTYLAMWGPSEYRATGVLRSFDRTADLSALPHPTLFTCGRHDEATPESTSFYASLMPNASVEVFENSAHVAFHEETDRYLEVVGRFLAAQDAS